MSTTVPAIKGKMGKIEYYTAKMRARQLVSSTRKASEGDDWASMSIEERLQRELNDKRVREELVPYLAKAADRFFGSILVLVRDPDVFEYEPLDAFVKSIPAAYRKSVDEMGVLTIDGGELIILDGQHRWAALRSVINRQNDRGEEIEGDFVGQVADDELVVVFIPYIDAETTRRVFNKINRNARPTGRGDNIVTSEDDGYAILSRRLVRDGQPLGIQVISPKGGKAELIVNWRSNTIGARSLQLTTISAVYETVKDILAHYKITNWDEKSQVVRPSEDKLDEAYEHVHDWWTLILNGIDVFQQALANPLDLPTLRESSPQNLLLRPAAHIVLVRGLVKAVERGVPLEDAIAAVNKIDWREDANLWRGVLIASTGRIVARSENYQVTSELIAYLIAPAKVPDRDALTAEVARFRGEKGAYQLP